MSLSTPLDHLEETVSTSGPSTVPPADEERIRRIVAEMNASDTVQAPPPVAGMAAPRVLTEPPLTKSMGQVRMDAETARANIIGGSAPSMADFQSMFAQAAPGMAPYHGPAVVPAAVVPPPAKSATWKQQLTSHLRAPVAVAIIVFLLNLPVVTSMLSRYASWMYLSSGEISIGGLLVKAILAGTMFAVYQAATSLL
jgi:hypothetical protein